MKQTAVEQLLLELLRIPSESGNEQEIINFLQEKLADELKISSIPVDTKRSNLLCISGDPKKLFVAHVDTVPGQLEIKIDDEKIYGRGSCDNKAAAAAMIVSILQSCKEGKTDFGLLFTVGEETTFDGAKAASQFLKQQGMQPELIVIGEPTGLLPVTGQRGVLCLEITCSGKKAHSSTENSDSAIHKLVHALESLITTSFSETIFNIGLISGGEAENIVAPRAQASVHWRSLLPDIRQRVESLMKSFDTDCNYKITKDIPPVDRNWPQFQKNIVSFFTEMYFFENSIVLGPGDIAQAHSENEFVSRAELNQSVADYGNQIK